MESNTQSLEVDQNFLKQVLELASENVRKGERPFAAIIVDANNKIVAKCGNQMIGTGDPLAHAELLAIREACKNLGSTSLKGCTMYKTCLPCPMCVAALNWVEISRFIYAYDRKMCEDYGFNDKHIQEEMAKKQEDRKIPFIQLQTDTEFNPFLLWNSYQEKKSLDQVIHAQPQINTESKFIIDTGCQSSQMECDQKRTLGTPITFEDTCVDSVCSQIDTIKSALKIHGVVCLKGLNFSEEDMIKLGRALGDELVILPKELSFNNKDPKYPPIARIGNILMDGTLKDSSKEATVWHQDGNFWDPADSYIFNLLHSKVLPTQGGDTIFMDLMKAKEKLLEEKPELYEKLRNYTVKVETAKIPDFIPLLREGMDLRTSYHKIVHTHPFTGKEVLFLSNPSHEIIEEQCPVKLQELIQFAIDAGTYTHKWQEGDMLIWDNVQVMHRSAGAFEGRRLLFRVQARMKFQNQSKTNDIFETALIQKHLTEACQIASTNVQKGGGPFGAIITDITGKVLSKSQNAVVSSSDPTAHAEICAIREACSLTGSHKLEGCTIYCSCEPCPMCLAALYWSRISKIYFAANRQDAKSANFDDHFIYEEFHVGLDQRSITTKCFRVNDSAKPFEDWNSLSQKQHY